MNNNSIIAILITTLILFIVISVVIYKRKKTDEETIKVSDSNKIDSKSESFVKLLGGKNNIKEVVSCKTRLKIEVIDGKIVEKNNEKYINSGAAGIIVKGENKIDIIVGFDVQNIHEQIDIIQRSK